MQYVTQQGSSQICCSVRVVANIIMQPVWRLVPRPSSGQGGNVQIVKYARLAGEPSLEDQIVFYMRDLDDVFNGCMMLR